jgi:hypothetical protein
MKNFDYSTLNLEDNISVEDITDRIEELEEAQEALRDEFDADEENDGVDFDNWVRNQIGLSSEEKDELQALTTLIDELEGMGGDHKWRGDWYPANLIRDSYFEDAMNELLDDIGDIPKDLPCYLSITVDYVALQQDYSSVEVNGVTYWCR